MKLQTIFFAFVAPVALCQNVGPSGSDLLAVLRNDSDTTGFAQLLSEFPDLIANLDPAKRYTVLAPSNAAVAEFRQSFNINGSLVSRSNHLNRRSLSDFAAAIALHFADESKQGDLNTQPTDLITNLTDPAFVNLGPASVSAPLSSSSSVLSNSGSVPSTTSSPESSFTSVPSTTSLAELPVALSQLPSSSASLSGSTLLPTSSPLPLNSRDESNPPVEPCHIPSYRRKGDQKRSITPYSPYFRRQLGGSALVLSSGFGNQTEASLSAVPYSNGTVRKVDSFLTLFGDLASTLQQTNGTEFSDALSRAGTLDSLSNTPKITVFVPTDSALQGQTLDAISLKRYVLLNTLATSSTLKAGSYITSAGDSVNVTSNADGSFSVNNATIVKSNVMIKNGVIHYLDNVYTGTLTASAPGFNIPTLAITIALLVSSASIF